jgi:hypothetical protein
MSARKAIAALAVVAASAAGACDDVSPLPYTAPARDAEVPDHVDLGQVAACRACATVIGSTCRAAFDQCQASDPRCGGLLECLTDTNCWRQLNIQNFTDPPPCARDCLRRAGVVSINEIGGPATQFYVCIVDPAKCEAACFGDGSAATGDQ